MWKLVSNSVNFMLHELLLIPTLEGNVLLDQVLKGMASCNPTRMVRQTPAAHPHYQEPSEQQPQDRAPMSLTYLTA